MLSLFTGVEKPLLKPYLIPYSMKAVIFRLMFFLLLVILLTMPSATAQNDEEDSANTCIFASFCLITLFIMFLIYISAKRKAETSQGERPRWGTYSQTHQRGYRYPMPRPVYPPPAPSYQQRPEPQKRDVKCDLCNSKNLRFFEGGYVKCNDCRHVFYITEIYRRKKGR